LAHHSWQRSIIADPNARCQISIIQIRRKTKTKNWFKLAFQFRGSVILAIYQRVIGFGLFSFFVSVLYYFNLPVSQPILGSIIPSIVLGLL